MLSDVGFLLSFQFSLVAQIFITVMEKQVSDFGKQHLHTIIESGSEGIVADDSAVVGRQSHPSDVCLHQRVLQVDFD